MMIIGGPVSHREWILERWYDHAETAAENAGQTIRFLHVGDPNTDPATWDIINSRHGNTIKVAVDEPERQDARFWPPHRFRHMVELRNLGLQMVRALEPDYFLSLDTDILLHPDAIVSLLDAIEGWDAVGGKCYMTFPSTREPSWGMFKREGGIARRDTEPGSLFPCEVIMGIKLMSPAAYKIDYKFDTQGEDLGWARNARDAGLRIRFDGRVTSKHCYDPVMLDQVDDRLGW